MSIREFQDLDQHLGKAGKTVFLNTDDVFAIEPELGGAASTVTLKSGYQLTIAEPFDSFELWFRLETKLPFVDHADQLELQR